MGGPTFAAPDVFAGTKFGERANGELALAPGAAGLTGGLTMDLAKDAADSSTCSSIIGGMMVGFTAFGLDCGKGAAPSYPQSSAYAGALTNTRQADNAEINKEVQTKDSRLCVFFILTFSNSLLADTFLHKQGHPIRQKRLDLQNSESVQVSIN